MSETKAPSSAATTAWHALSPEEALAQQKVDPEAGLAASEVDSRRATFGSNKFAEAAKEPPGSDSCASTATRCRSCSSGQAS